MTRPARIAFIKARWHADIVDKAHLGFVERLQELLPSAALSVFEVPGAFEMPFLAKRLAMSGDFDVIAAAAFVVNGGIYRHDFVAQAVVTGLMDVQLETDVPVLSVSLTPHHFQPTDEHIAFFKAHFVKKGREAADAAAAVLAYDQAAPHRDVA
ncbi:MAG: 6,7-dimethyl-8-ribityllumazine synthase [Rhizobiales bacterium]|nr:6,7-dimethyl-8-ribityllumazine synthase [Hyphomicrobiales bacterium]